MISSVFIAVAGLIGLGFCALVLKRNLVKIAMAIVVLGSAANLFLVSLGYRENAIAPIFTSAPELWMVLPTPQSLTLTSIVISLGVSALMLSFAIIIYRQYGSLDSANRRLKE